MQKIFILAALLIGSLSFASAQTLRDKINQVKNQTDNSGSGVKLSNEDVVAGLKEALTIGARKSVDVASVTDGFYSNPLIFIPFPEEAATMKDRLEKMGLDKQVKDFEKSLNNAAEEAAKEAFTIFSSAISGMTVNDGFAILKGNDTAATHYLRTSTTPELTQKFSPIVKKAIDKVNVTAYWTPLANSYNKIPGVKKQNPDLEAYVTSKAIDGLMLLISEKEKDIRTNTAAQVNDLLKKVFGGKN